MIIPFYIDHNLFRTHFSVLFVLNQNTVIGFKVFIKQVAF